MYPNLLEAFAERLPEWFQELPAYFAMLMVGFGVAGWLLRKLEVPLVPVILGILLGNQMEVNLRRAMTISDGDWLILVGSPLTIILWIIAITGFVLPMLLGRRVKKRMEAARNEEEFVGD